MGFYSLARHLVSNFDFLEKDLQMQILEVVDATIEKDPHLMALALKQQSTLHAQRARELFDSRKLGPLEDLLRSLAPAAAIMVNIEVSSQVPATQRRVQRWLGHFYLTLTKSLTTGSLERSATSSVLGSSPR